MKKWLLCAVSAIFCFYAFSAFGQAVEVDPKLESYTPVSGISGTISSVGSDTLNNEMTLWAEGFKALYPNVKIGIEGKGSSTGSDPGRRSQHLHLRQQPLS